MEENLDHTCCNLDELTKLRTENEKFKSILGSLFPDKVAYHPFLTGKGGESDRNGLPEYFFICPAYGSDAVYTYKRYQSN